MHCSLRTAPLLFCIALLLSACGANREDEGIDTQLWKEFQGGAKLDPIDDAELRERLSQVQSIGYLDGVRPAEEIDDAVTYVNPELAWPGYNLYLSGGDPEARLVDMLGRPLHSWRKSIEDVWPAEAVAADPELAKWIPPTPEERKLKDSWQRGYLMPGGGMIALIKDIGVIRIDRDSNLLWSRLCVAHHDLDVAKDGRVHVLVSEPRVLPRIHPSEPQLDDLIAILSPDGEEIRRISIHDAFANSPFAGVLDRCEPSGDPFHTNSIQILDAIPETEPPLPGAFRPGALLVSVRELDTIGVIDPETGAFDWVQTGPWKEQHHATLNDSGVITLFDNVGNPTPYGESRVVDFDPVAGAVTWEYGGDETNHFYSHRRGNIQRLPNGNSLINESDNGRAFEVTPDKRIAWEFINPNRAGKDNRFIAVFRTFERIDPAEADAWLYPEESESAEPEAGSGPE